MPSILYITAQASDFLADSLLHGLRSLLGANVVDYPRCRLLDASLDDETKRTMHGRGFTLYGRMPDAEGDAVDRDRVWERVAAGEFDLVIFSSIWRQFDQFIKERKVLRGCRTVLIDGEDRPMYFPWSGTIARRGFGRLVVAAWAARGMVRFMRERPESWVSPSFWRKPWTIGSHFICGGAVAAAPPRTIAFSIPQELIVQEVPRKDRVFFDHVVDADTARYIPGSSTAHLYHSESLYFDGLSRSKFAITCKRAGWDCLRHYEIAARGCVPCFRLLGRKPPNCAPHGLQDGVNCLAYSEPLDLFERVAAMTEGQYQALALGAISWAQENTTVRRASEVLSSLGFPSP